MPRPILIDSDMLLYLAAVNAQKEIEWSTDIWTLYCDVSEARAAYWDTIDQWCELFGSSRDDCWHCFTDGSAFRRRIQPDYKANRKEVKPLGYLPFRQELMEEAQATLYSEIEADDMLSVLAGIYRDGKPDCQPVIASGDKDLRQVPGTHVWIRQPLKEIKAYYDDPNGKLSIVKNDYTNPAGPTYCYEVSPAEAARYRWMQGVLGDPTDGIKGCPGVGEVNAVRFANTLDLKKPLDCWEETVRLYAEAKGRPPGSDPYETALLQARLVRVLLPSQYDFDTHEVTLWTPPTR